MLPWNGRGHWWLSYFSRPVWDARSEVDWMDDVNLGQVMGTGVCLNFSLGYTVMRHETSMYLPYTPRAKTYTPSSAAHSQSLVSSKQ
jgi:hypothetical protein